MLFKENLMRRNFLALGMGCLLMTGTANALPVSENLVSVNKQIAAEPKDLIGRWDITVDVNGKMVN